MDHSSWGLMQMRDVNWGAGGRRLLFLCRVSQTPATSLQRGSETASSQAQMTTYSFRRFAISRRVRRSSYIPSSILFNSPGWLKLQVDICNIFWPIDSHCAETKTNWVFVCKESSLWHLLAILDRWGLANNLFRWTTGSKGCNEQI